MRTPKIALTSYALPTSRRLSILGVSLALLFSVTAIQRFWVHPSGGHTHRQAVTIGMSIAFAEEVRARGLAALDFLIYPRVLERGLLDGINASEFPLLNVITGPFFLISTPWVGVFLTSLMILLFNLYVAYVYLPRFLRAWNVEVSGPICLLLWLTGATLATQVNTIMPEGFAFPLVVMGMVQLLESQNKKSQFVAGVVLCTLGIAVKPTVVVSLGAIAVLPWLVRERKAQWKALLFGCVLSVVFPGWWYAIHAKTILSFAQGPQVFMLADFNPLKKLGEVGFSGLAFLLRREPYQGELPIFVGWFFVIAGWVLGEWKVVGLYFLSLIAATSLDGPHIYVHYYYFIGTCIFAIVLMARVMAALQPHRFFKTLAIVFLAWGVAYNIRGNVWVWARDSRYWKVNFWDMGRQAASEIDRSDHLITDDTPFPLKLLWIGRSGTAAGGQVYEVCNQAQYSRLPLVLVSDVRPPFPGVEAPLCGGRPVEYRTVETPFAKWYVTKVLRTFW
ncbi:hypothetical protein WDW37_20065 [Bdellovibrionota bacterium FG-1]